MFITDLTPDDKSTLTQELILNGIPKKDLLRIKPLEEVLKEEVPYNTTISTALDIGTLESSTGLIPNIFKIFEEYHRYINDTSAQYNLGFLNISKIVLDNIEIISKDNLETLEKVLLTQSTSTIDYRKMVLKFSDVLWNLIYQELRNKVNIIEAIQEQCYIIFNSPGLLVKYFRQDPEYKECTEQDFQNPDRVYIPCMIFSKIIQGEFPELDSFLFAGQWGDSLIDFEDIADSSELIEYKMVLDFCKERLLSLGSRGIPPAFNDCVALYAKELGNFYTTNNLLPNPVYVNRFHNKSSFANRISNVLDIIIKKRIKRYLISRICANATLEASFLLENQMQIYQDYGYEDALNGATISQVRKNANSGSPKRIVLNKPKVQEKHYNQYRNDLLPYFNKDRLGNKIITKDSSGFEDVLITVAKSFQSRSELFEWFHITLNIIGVESNKLSKQHGIINTPPKEFKNNEPNVFKDFISLNLKVVFFKLIESTKNEGLVYKNYTSVYNTVGIVEDYILTIERILIFWELLQDILVINKFDKSKDTFWEIFSDFIVQINKEIPLLENIEEMQDELFQMEDNRINIQKYKFQKLKFLYTFNKQNTYRVQLQYTIIHRIIIEALIFQNLPEEKKTTKKNKAGFESIQNYWDTQDSYIGIAYGQHKKREFLGDFKSNEFYSRLFSCLNRDLKQFINFFEYFQLRMDKVLDNYLVFIKDEIQEAVSTQEPISLVRYQLLCTVVLEKVNIINSSNNILLKGLFDNNAFDDTELSISKRINKIMTKTLKRNDKVKDILIELLVQPINSLNIVVPTFRLYQETVSGTRTRLINYVESTVLPLLYIITNAGGTKTFQDGGTFVTSSVKLVQTAWLELQSHANCINNILLPLAEASYSIKKNSDRQFDGLFLRFQAQDNDTVMTSQNFNFQEHLEYEPERDSYYKRRDQKLEFFRTATYSIGTTESFVPDNIYLDYETLANGGDTSLELSRKYCPIFRDYFVYHDFKYLITGTAGNMGFELDCAFKKDNLVSRIYALALLPVHDFQFNILSDRRSTDLVPKFLQHKKAYGQEGIDQHKELILSTIYQFRDDVQDCLQDCYLEFQDHDNYYYSRLGNTMNLLVDSDSPFYSSTQLHKWLKSTWRVLPYLWNLPDVFLKGIPRTGLFHILSWASDKPKVLGMFFSQFDFDKLLSKKFKFKTYLFQEIVRLFHDNYKNPDKDVLDTFLIQGTPNYKKDQARFQDLANQDKDNVVTEERIRRVFQDEDGILPNLDSTSNKKIGYSHYIKYYEAFFQRYIKMNCSTEEEEESLKNALVQMNKEILKGGSVGIPAGISLNCFRNELEGTRKTFLELFSEQQLTMLIPVDLITDIIDEDNEDEENDEKGEEENGTNRSN